MQKTKFKTLTNASGFTTKSIGGHNYLIVPAVPVKEQVMNHYLVPASELEFAQIWNGIPITIRHPVRNNGSANVPEPDVAVIGKFYNGQWDDTNRRVTGEYWIDIDEAMKYVEGQYVVNAVYMGTVLETSTGYWADEEAVTGNFNGRDYTTIHHNLRPDHIAILVDAIGACSVADGCGVNRNSLYQELYTNECAETVYLQGGPGSGDFSHGGRPGQVGGSSPRTKLKPPRSRTEGKTLNRQIKAYYVTPKDKASKYSKGYNGRISLMSRSKAETLFDRMTRGGFDPVLFEVNLKRGTPYSSITSSSITVPGFPGTAVHTIDLEQLKSSSGGPFRNNFLLEGNCGCPEMLHRNQNEGETDSLSGKIEDIRSAFYREFMQPSEIPYIKDIFEDHCLVEYDEEMYNAYFTTNDAGEIEFDPKEKWKKLELVETQDSETTDTADTGSVNENETMPASCYLVFTDGVGHLPVKDASGKPNHRLMGAAWAALHGGYRGNKYAGPNKQQAIAKLKALYAKEKMPLPSANMQMNVVAADAPAELKRIFERVYTDALKKVKDKARAARIAWGAVKKAGWMQDSDGKWSKEKKGDAVSNERVLSVGQTLKKESTMSKKFSVSHILDLLRGKGVEVQVNNEEELEDMELDLREGDETADTTATLQVAEGQFTPEEVKGLKALAAMDWTKVNAMIDRMPTVLEMAQNAEAEKATKKAELVGIILNTGGNVFSKEELEAMNLPMLTKLNSQLNFSYAGLGGAPAFNNQADEEVLGLPDISFVKE